MKAKIPKPAKPRKAWFIVEPGGRIVDYSGRATREEAARDFVKESWGLSLQYMYECGYRLVQCDITPIVKRRN